VDTRQAAPSASAPKHGTCLLARGNKKDPKKLDKEKFNGVGAEVGKEEQASAKTKSHDQAGENKKEKPSERVPVLKKKKKIETDFSQVDTAEAKSFGGGKKSGPELMATKKKKKTK